MTFAQFKQTRLFKVLKNKYLITLVVFVCLILFSPKNNIIYYFKLQKQLDELEQQKEFLQNEIKSDSIRFSELEKDIDAAEKFGREKYMMKRENEDIFVIKHKEDTDK